MSNPIPVGMASDGLVIMQAMKRLMHEEGVTLSVQAQGEDNVAVVLLRDEEVVRAGQGPTFSVALRRMTTGLSRDYGWMTKNG